MSGAQRLFRVDPRLVHATMMNVWVPTTGTRILLIGDATLARDSKKRAILEMSAMGLVDVRFRPETELKEEIERCDPSMPVIVLFSSIEGADRACASGLAMDRLNIGHVPEAPDRDEVHPAVHLGPRDFDVIERLQDRGVEVFIQPLPQDKLTVVPRRKKSTVPPPRETPLPRVARAKLRVVNARGLHLRAAHLLAHLCGKVPGDVTVAYEGSSVNAKSLLGLTTLGATAGAVVDVHVEAPEAEAWMARIRDLFATGFDEGCDWVGDGADEGLP